MTAAERCSRMTLVNNAMSFNRAGAGGGIYWRVPLPFTQHERLVCRDCEIIGNTVFDIATNGVNVRLRPAVDPVATAIVESGSTIAVSIPNDDARPRAVVADAFNQIAVRNNDTMCALQLENQTDSAAAAPMSAQTAAQGVVSYDQYQLFGDVGSTADVRVTCVINERTGLGSVQLDHSFALEVRRCHVGWDLTESKTCRRCPEHFYSVRGINCLECPEGGNCSTVVEEQTETGQVASQLSYGVEQPVEIAGYWLGPARTSVLESTGCKLLRSQQGGCREGQIENVRQDGFKECAESNFASAEMLYGCFYDRELYRCRTSAACTGGMVLPHGSNSTTVGLVTNSSCKEGHIGALCDQCLFGWELNAQRVCRQCSSAWTFFLGTGLAVLGVCFIVYLYLVFGIDEISGLGSSALTKVKEKTAALTSVRHMFRNSTKSIEDGKVSVVKALRLPFWGRRYIVLY